MKCKKVFILFLIFCPFIIKAQNPISFEEALKLTLANNYDIQLARVDEEVAANNASKANNNYLPTITGSGDLGWTYFNGENRSITGTNAFDANNSYSYGASLIASYTLFDGKGRRYSYLQSKESLNLTELQLEQIIQNTILELSRIYHEVARLEESAVSLKQAVDISKDRLVRAEYDYDYGQSNKLNVLNAKVDLNADSVALLTGLQELENLKRNLNFVMGQEVDQELTVENTVEIKQNLVREEVIAITTKENLDLKMAKSNIQINQYAIGNAKSKWLPSLDANAGYIYRGTENPNGAFLLGSQTIGPQAGLTLSWSLFNGSNNATIKNAKLNLKSREIEQQSLEQNVRSQALNAFTSYQNFLFILHSQTDNIAIAQDNFKRSQSAYQLGQINSIEFRQAQLNLLNAEQALSKAKYDAKNAELQVLAVMGRLLE